ncbi:hypothetical protein, partial [Parachlamydia sp.]|uniref:hypothetical protein n=1 Tax=Parachlamydia sp. TaxID=2052048 RepID=UPI003D1368D8
EDHKRQRTTLNNEKFSKTIHDHLNELNVFDNTRQGDIYERLNHRNAYIYSSLNTLIKHYARNLLTKSVLAKLEFANWHTRSIGIQLYNLKSISSLIEDVKLFQTKIHDYRTETLPKEKAEKKFAILETGRKFMEEGEYAISYNYLFDRVEKIFIDNNNLIKKLNEEIETPFTLELDAYDKDTRDKVQEIYLEAHVTIKKHKEMLISELTENLTDLQDAMNALHEELTYSRIVIVDRKGEPPASKTLTQLWSQPKYFKAPAFSISS